MLNGAILGVRIDEQFKGLEQGPVAETAVDHNGYGNKDALPFTRRFA